MTITFKKNDGPKIHNWYMHEYDIFIDQVIIDLQIHKLDKLYAIRSTIEKKYQLPYFQKLADAKAHIKSLYNEGETE
jgi:hypothetical protein